MRQLLRLVVVLGAATSSAVAFGAGQPAEHPPGSRSSPARARHVAEAPKSPRPQAQAQAPAAAANQATGTSAAAPPPRPPLRTEIWNFDNWATTCQEFEDKKKVCTAQLQVTQSGSHNVVFAWMITLDNENRAVNVLQTPTGVSIAPGVEIRLGQAAPRNVPFTTCETGRCTATLPMDRNVVRDMAQTSDAEIVIYAPNGTGVQFKFPFKGFDKAYAQLSR